MLLNNIPESPLTHFKSITHENYNSKDEIFLTNIDPVKEIQSNFYNYLEYLNEKFNETKKRQKLILNRKYISLLNHLEKNYANLSYHENKMQKFENALNHQSDFTFLKNQKNVYK